MFVPDKPLVIAYLIEAKGLINQGHIRYKDRDKNRDTLAKLAITYERRDAIVGELTYHQFSHCEEPLPGRAECAWVFGATEGPHEIYIKLQTLTVCRPHIVLCISFHEAERHLWYPFRVVA